MVTQLVAPQAGSLTAELCAARNRIGTKPDYAFGLFRRVHFGAFASRIEVTAVADAMGPARSASGGDRRRRVNSGPVQGE